MTKKLETQLEALERLKTAPTFMGGTIEYQACTKSETMLMQDYEIVKQALLELQSIKDANPSEALNGLESYINNIIFAKDLINQKQQLLTNITAIKQALLKAEKEHNALEIIKEKEVNMQVFNQCEDVKTYNKVYIKQKDRQLTQEEFSLLKEVTE